MYRSPALPAWLLMALAVHLPASAAPLTVKVTDAAGAPLAEAVVAVQVQGAPRKAPPEARADMGQRNKTFVPHVLVVQTGTQVSFPNADTVRHHVYSFSPAKTFEIKLYAGMPSAPIEFDKPGTAVLGCNIHDRMNAFIHVVETPYFGKTDASGSVQIDLPAGEHELRLWHPSLGQDGLPQRHDIKMGRTGQTLTFAIQP